LKLHQVPSFVIIGHDGQWHPSRLIAFVADVPIYSECEAVFDNVQAACHYAEALEVSERV
jgi:hypothetical protein